MSLALSFASKKEDESGLSSYYNNKTTIIQEARVFNESPISPRKCRALLTRIVYLLYVGETFGTQEATTLFFGTTKLFQHKDSALRQAVYLAIKELATTAEDVIMVTSSIMKDMQPNSEVIYRPNAIRALCKIIDPSMAQGVERFFKAAIVDRNPSISSAALVSAYHLFPNAKDVVKRWVNEAQEAVNAKSTSSLFGSSGGGGGYLGFGGGSNQQSGPQTLPSTSYIPQYHALGLLYLIRQQDRMAVTKMIQQLGGGKSGAGTTLKNPMALCMLIRYAAKVMEEDSNMQRQVLELLEGWLRHKSDMVNFEAARVICEMKGVTAAQLTKPISVLQVFLTTPKPVLKFAAARTLAALALTHPASVATCNIDLETLIADPNRSVATYAITTLLKTGNEASVDRLIKQISGFMTEISDEFKVIIVDAIRSLCLKFPTKHASMLTFLSGVLRDEGGYDFKRAVVEAMFDMIKFIPESKEQALSHLCEFIEDCEFTKLSVRILHLLGVEGPKSPQPAKYIRFIYNRVVLENATVRAAAVTSLAKFGVNSAEPALKKSVNVLLNRCLDDVDDEVRDRATLYLKVFKAKPLADAYVKEESVFSLAALESKLVAYVKDPTAAEQPFDVSTVPKISRAQAAQEAARPSTLDTIGAPLSKKTAEAPAAPSAAEKQSQYVQQLAEVPEFASYGPVLNSSANPAQLTENETEYQVNCVKHIFKEHVVFQFNISNTIPDTVLEQVSVIMQPQSEDSGLVEDFIIPLPSLAASSPGIVYVSFTRENPDLYAIASFQCTLKYISKEVDPSTGIPEEEGYEDEYQVEEVELSAGGDYIIPSYASFGSEWDRMRSAPSATETFALSVMESLKESTRKLRMRPSSEQTEELKKLYNINPHPTAEQRQALADSIGMRYQSITNWFQNQRSLAKKKREDDGEPTSSLSAPKPEYSDGSRQYSAFPPPSHPHPSLGLPPPTSHPSLVHPSVLRRSPSVSPSTEGRSPRRSSSLRSSTPYGSTPATFARPRRSRPEPYQLEALKDLFKKTSTPTIEERSALALEVGMDVGKVTNWFRNLRQTARKRAKKSGSGDDEDDESFHSREAYSASASRSGTPSLGSSSSSLNDDSMDLDDYDMTNVHSDNNSDDEYQEAVTPSPEPSPSPPLPSLNILESFNFPYPIEIDKASVKQFSGIRVEDALLLLSFHNHVP
ncbi:unnamed protein product [Cyclocybe aegerita]|uniref:Homeobox domain-containing protein n=1 Tax=Cyclocybe aegerita TaxID=1973307 RepID=A0A8S0W6I2_CYCAE|nr:unnamed protein product [Cyclocybe aegerita]